MLLLNISGTVVFAMLLVCLLSWSLFRPEKLFVSLTFILLRLRAKLLSNVAPHIRSIEKFVDARTFHFIPVEVIKVRNLVFHLLPLLLKFERGNVVFRHNLRLS